MVSRAEVERRESPRAVHRVKARVDSRQGVHVLLVGLVQTMVVDAETQRSVFLPTRTTFHVHPLTAGSMMLCCIIISVYSLMA